MAFLVSGLVSLLPTERKLSALEESCEESQEEIEHYLRQMRKDRGQGASTGCVVRHEGLNSGLHTDRVALPTK
jgi:hypothetical protein